MTTKVFTVAEMVAAERAADQSGVSYAEMMETAGRRVAAAIMERTAVRHKNVLVLVGPGNNGGDGLVAGRYLAEAGADVAFYLFRPRDAADDENFRLVQEMELFVVEAPYDQRYRVLRTRLNGVDIVLDALLGTGVTRPIEGDLAALLKQARAGIMEQRSHSTRSDPLTSIAGLPANNAPPAPVPLIAAVDCPSGLNCDTGALDPLAIAADLTVTFAGPKRGHFRFPGAAACGELVVADINIAADLPEVAAVPLSLVTADWARSLLPPRPLDGHKGTFGTALIIAGSENYWGAPVLSARGALRTGAGLVALAVPTSIRPTVAGQLPEATYPAVSAQGMLDEASVPQLQAALGNSSALLVGPGLGPAHAFLAHLLQAASLPPLVIDADGLNVLSEMSGWPDLLPPGTILTPHPGEMARLTGYPLNEVKNTDRVALAGRFAQEWGHIVLLKGAFTVVAAPDGRCALLPFANPLLAAGGSGDVLAGIIAALLAQGLTAYDAAVLGAYLHGTAGEVAAETFGDSGMLAHELADLVPGVRRRLFSS